MGLLDQFKAYVAANTPRSTRAPVSPATVIYDGLLRQPVENVKANAAQFGAELQQAPQDLRGLLSPEFGAQVRQQMNQPASIDKSKAMAMAMDYLQTTNPVAGMVGAIKAYHGSPHKFDKFDMSKLGSGEGAQAYGHGLYFADNVDVADSYRKRLTNGVYDVKNLSIDGAKFKRLDFPTAYNARKYGRSLGEAGFTKKQIKVIDNLSDQELMVSGDVFYSGDINKLAERYAGKSWNKYGKISGDEKKAEVLEKLKTRLSETKKGNLYETSLRWPDPAREASDPLGPQHFLDWDKPLSEQTKNVQNVFSDIASWKHDGITYPDPSMLSGEGLYGALERQFGSAGKATDVMKDSDIPGIRYLDGNSRGAVDGSYNYVVFDDAIPEIVSRNGEPAGLLDMGKKKAKK